jgi:histidine triad (HIT) family protein
MNCIFCNIAKREIEADIVYEDNYSMAFLDIGPANPGHILIISKEHYKNLDDVDEIMLAYVTRVVKRVGNAVKKGLGVSGYNVIINNGAVSGQVIDHFHCHLIPRYDNDGLTHWPARDYQATEAKKLAKKIIANLVNC